MPLGSNMNTAATSTLRLRIWLYVLVLACGALVAFVIAERVPTQTSKIVGNLMRIDSLKLMWAFDHGTNGAVKITERELAPYLPAGSQPDTLVVPVAGERYVLNPLSVLPEAQLTQKVGKMPKGTVIRLLRGERKYEVILPNPPLQATARRCYGFFRSLSTARA